MIKIFKKIPHWMWYIVGIFIVSRIIFSIWGISIHQNFEACLGCDESYPKSTLVQTWGKWDTGQYINIATNGYSPKIKGFHFKGVNYVFLPLYPMLIRYFSIFTKIEPFMSGLIIANLSFITALILLYKLARIDFDEKHSLKIVKYMFLLPVSFMFSSILTESLFLFLMLLCFYLARKKMWLLSGIAGILISLTRPIGFIVMIPLIVEYLYQLNFNFAKLKWNILYLLLPLFGIFSFAIFNYRLTGDYLGFIHMQSLWGRRPGNLIFNLLYELIYFDKIVPIYCLILFYFIFYSLEKIRLSYWVLCILLFLIPLSTGIQSIFRLTVVIFPLAYILANFASSKTKDIILSIVLIVFQVCLFMLWQSGSTIVI